MRIRSTQDDTSDTDARDTSKNLFLSEVDLLAFPSAILRTTDAIAILNWSERYPYPLGHLATSLQHIKSPFIVIYRFISSFVALNRINIFNRSSDKRDMNKITVNCEQKNREKELQYEKDIAKRVAKWPRGY